jgi:site-specific DNA recombinase
MNSYFAYIRVSTVKQGEHGSSLQEQRDAIIAFAARNDFTIAAWFEERETAAKVGRREFSRMISALKKGKATGVIFHKIDRSARNLNDWSAVQDLADQGIDVRFSQESINLGSNEGKLTGDFMAVISAHYIRNLREEVKKGIRGRLKQGIYPLAAPIGYLDQGGGKAKVPDPQRAPFIRLAFELYANGKFSLHALKDELYARGLRSKSGQKVQVNSLAVLLRNPFYIGVIRMRRSGETYAGIHEPIIPTRLFEQVRAALDGKANAKIVRHDFVFRRMLKCSGCDYRLIGEKQKGHIYYRCHSRTCRACSLREEAVDGVVRAHLAPLGLSKEEADELREMVQTMRSDWTEQRQAEIQAVNVQLDNVNARATRLMDVYLDNAIDRRLFEEKKFSLLMERKALEEGRAQIEAGERSAAQDMLKYLERVESLPLSYEIGNTDERREVLKSITSNLCVDRKNVVVELRSPFREIAKLAGVPTGAPVRSKPRTRVTQIFDILMAYSATLPKDRHPIDEIFPAAA